MSLHLAEMVVEFLIGRYDERESWCSFFQDFECNFCKRLKRY